MQSGPISQLYSARSKMQSIVSYALLILLSLAFVLSDWIYKQITFAEYILLFILILLILTVNFKLKREQLVVITGLVAFLAAHVMLQYAFNDAFVIRTAVMGILKLLFYSVMVTVVINYLREHKLTRSFLIINNVLAVLVIFIGVYITLELYRETRVPQEIFWRFTRRDIYSYYFESNPAIIRTRSIFSEPAHLGFYLNTLIAVNLFSKVKSKGLFIFSVVLSLGILSTFSYSMIGILMVIVLIKIALLFYTKSFKWSNWLLLIPLSLVLFSIFYWDIIETTLIQRTVSVFTGQDTSARMRLFDSWQYVDRSTILLGNGLGQTPVVTNVYAYAVSDFGIAGLLVLSGFTIWILRENWALGLIFILLNSAKGGYLSSGYWLMILLIVLYTVDERVRTSDITKNSFY